MRGAAAVTNAGDSEGRAPIRPVSGTHDPEVLHSSRAEPARPAPLTRARPHPTPHASGGTMAVGCRNAAASESTAHKARRKRMR